VRRRQSVVYVHGRDFYCHCADHDACDNAHAEDEDVPNDDIAAFQYRVDLRKDSDADELYHTVESLMYDLVNTGGDWEFQPGDAYVVDLDTGVAYDAAEFRDAHL
jgi:hypothetical protein